MSSRARLSRCSQIHRFRRARLTRCTSDILGNVHREKKMQLASSTEATNQRLQLAWLYEYSNQTKAPCIWQTWPEPAPPMRARLLRYGNQSGPKPFPGARLWRCNVLTRAPLKNIGTVHRARTEQAAGTWPRRAAGHSDLRLLPPFFFFQNQTDQRLIWYQYYPKC